MESGWLQILKASWGQLLTLSFALGVFWYLFQIELLPPSDSPWVVYGLPLAVLITGGLGLAPFIEWLAGLVKSGVEEWLKKRRRAEAIAIHTQEFVDYIPFMNDDERAIFGYLLEHQQKTFTAEMNCGTGAALLKRGFIKSQVIVGLSYDMAGFPFLVPDHIWEKLEEYRDAFPQKHTGGSLPWFKGVW